jgi:elongation factor Ts
MKDIIQRRQIKMSYTSEHIKQLREKTGAGFMDCKKALESSSGDIDRAVTFLREKGLASAGKKASRATNQGMIGSYVHGVGKIAVMVEVNCETDFVAKNEKFQALVKDIAMHVAASSPRYVRAEDVPAEIIESEKSIFRVQAQNSGKPAPVIEKIVDGKIAKFYDEVCLLNQQFIKNTDIKISDLVKEHIATIGENITIKRFVRWQLGEEETLKVQ